MCLTSAPLQGFVGIEWPEINFGEFELPKIDFSSWFGSKANALAESGKCGENVYWNYNNSTRKLVISGTGQMKNYDPEESVFNYSNIKSIVIENGVTTIGDYAFEHCESLTSVSIPKSVTEIGSAAFWGCSNLADITLHDNINDIGSAAFKDTAYYYNYENWDGDVLYLGKHLIESRETISGDYQIKDGTRVIAGGAFSDRPNLTNVSIPNSVITIGEWAFLQCWGLTSMTIPDSVTTIGDSAFGFNFFHDFIFGKSVTSIGYRAFEYSSIDNVYISDLKNWCNIKFTNEESNPLGSVCFSGNLYLNGKLVEDIVFPNDITTINDFAFYGLESLKSITIPDSVTYIGDKAFYDCSNLNYISIGTSVIEIGKDAIKNTAYYNNTSNWKNDAMYVDSYLIAVKPSNSGEYNIKPGTRAVADYAFSGCSQLKSVNIPEGVIAISDGMFYHCYRLVKVTLPSSIKFIGSEAFYYCYNLLSIDIPDGVVSIRGHAFELCAVASIKIPNSVTSMNEEAFYCSGIVSITLGNGISKIKKGTFRWCQNLISITIPDSVTAIEAEAFSMCEYLISITIPDSVTIIKERAFYKCSTLSSIVVSNNLLEVRDYAFENCENIKNIYYKGTAEQANSINFGIGNESLLNANIHFNYDGVSPIIVSSGSCGENVSYILTSDGTLKISGEGAMYDYDYEYTYTKYFTPEIKINADYSYEIIDTTIKKVIIEDGVTKIGDGAFYNLRELESVDIPESVTDIGDNSFVGCDKLTNITIPVSIKSVGKSAFYNTGYYNNSANWENDVLYINKCLIGAKHSLTNANSIKNGTLVIASEAFRDCTELANITIPDSVVTIGEDAFFNTEYYNNNENWENEVLYIDKYLIQARPSLPDSYTIKDHTLIVADYAFSDCTKLTSITIPESVVSIGKGSFADCTNLDCVYYNGVKEQWQNVVIEEDNEDLLNAKIHFSVYDSTHEYISEITKEATCVEDGEITYTCTCGSKYIEKTPKIDHSYISEVTKETTCVEDGEITYTCSCGNKYIEITPKFDHNYTSKVTKEATCTEYGQITYTCSCGVKYTERINKIDHIYTSEVTKAATCSVYGERTYSCICGSKYTETIPKAEHSYTSEVTKEATCTVDGEITYTCKYGDKYIEIIPKTGHSHIVKTTKEATCTKDGQITYVCPCGDTYFEIIPAYGHSFEGFICSLCNYDKAANCKNGETIQFGSYPQTIVSESLLISKLNELASNSENWNSYKYYSSGAISLEKIGSMYPGDWMKYIDVSYNGEKYRGVQIEMSRPSRTYYCNLNSARSSYQRNNGYESGNVYWFKFEPINWLILDGSTGFVVCDTIIDSQPYSNTIYQNSTKDTYYNNSELTNYASDYETSSIRKWLNEDFYNTAFTELEKQSIELSNLDNNCYYTMMGTTGYEYLDSKETSDKIFLLSYEDVIDSNYGFNPDEKACDVQRKAVSSDYAKCQGIYVDKNESKNSEFCSHWLLRNSHESSVVSCGVTSSGDSYQSFITCTTCYGVRPALRFNRVLDDSGVMKEVTRGYKREHVVDNWKALNQSYKSEYLEGFAVPMDGTNGNPDYLIPGQSENMIPQGLTYWPEKDWVLVSSYDKSKENPSAIFALDRETGTFVAQFNMYTKDGKPWKCHAGGIGVSDNNLYITSGKGVGYFPLSDLDVASGTVKDITRADYVNFGQLGENLPWLNVYTDYVNVSDGILWAGNFYTDYPGWSLEERIAELFDWLPDSWDNPAALDYNSIVLGFELSGKTSEDEWNNLKAICDSATYRIGIDNDMQCIQGIAFKKVEGKKYRMYLSRTTNVSFGAEITVADITLNKTNLEVSKDHCEGFKNLPGTEGIVFIDNDLHILYESGALSYAGSLGWGTYKDLTDVIWKVNENDLLGLIGIRYEGLLNHKGIRYDYEYSDSYFAGSSFDYKHDLAIASYCLAISSMVNEGTGKDGKYGTDELDAARKFFSVTEFDNCQPYGYDKKPTNDSIACVIGHKNVVLKGQEETIIAIGIRGAGYGDEWSGNFRLGNSTDHAGFVKARKLVMEYLEQYIEDFGYSFNGNLKFWITGYSRAAATANLVAATLNNDGALNGVKFDFVNDIKDRYSSGDVYAYTFETPLNTTSKEASDAKYSNIYNFINRIDYVPKVAPSAWDYTRYGENLYMPSLETEGTRYYEYLDEMKKEYEKMTGEKYTEKFDFYEVGIFLEGHDLIPDDISLTKVNGYISQSEFLDEFIDIVANDVIISADNYVENYESSVRKLMPVIMNGSLNFDITKEDIIKEFSFIDLVTGHSERIVARVLRKKCAEILSVSGLTYDEAYDCLGIIDELVVASASNLDYVYTLIKNASDIKPAHEPSVNFAWLASIEPELYNVHKNGDWYLKFVYNCPIDIALYDENGELLATIIDDKVVFPDDRYLTVYVDSDGQKCFCLPNDTEYRFEILGTDEGTMTCSVSKYDFTENKTTEILNYYDIPVEDGTELTMTVNETIEEELTEKVEVTDAEEKIVNYDDHLESEEIETFNVSVTTDTENSYVSGGGTYYKGEYAQVEAVEVGCNKFMGWYIDNTCVSTELKYRHPVTESVVIEARFSEKHTMGEWYEIIPAACETIGNEQRDCSECSYFENRDIPVIEHSYEAVITPATCYSNGFTTNTCTKCGNGYTSDITAMLTHSLGGWYTVTAATCKSSGVEQRDCSACDYSETQNVPVTGHNYNNGVCTSCGDDLTANCSCNCHAGGIKGLIFKLILFFQKLFRMNRICKGCGISHY